MERKIGEIFEINGEWYQCVEGSWCGRCDFHRTNLSASYCDYHLYCSTSKRTDHKSVIFKKLEKLGDPFERNGYMYQEYKAHIFPLLMNGDAKIPTHNGFAVIIKQNKEEDMKTVKVSKDDLNFLVNKIRYGILPKCTNYDEIVASIIELFSEDANLSNTENIGKNLRPFNLEEAKADKPVCTRDGRKARIICFDRVTNSTNEYTGHLIVLVTNPNGDEQSFYYTEKGYLAGGNEYDNHKWALMMLPEKKEGWVNVYHGLTISERVCGNIVFNTKEEAIQYAQDDDSYITTVKISWEE